MENTVEQVNAITLVGKEFRSHLLPSASRRLTNNAYKIRSRHIILGPPTCIKSLQHSRSLAANANQRNATRRMESWNWNTDPEEARASCCRRSRLSHQRKPTIADHVYDRRESVGTRPTPRLPPKQWRRCKCSTPKLASTPPKIICILDEQFNFIHTHTSEYLTFLQRCLCIEIFHIRTLFSLHTLMHVMAYLRASVRVVFNFF